MKIRRALRKDFVDIAKIFMEESSKEPYCERYNSKTALKEVKDMSKKELYVAVEEKEIIGFISSNQNSDDKKKAYLRELWLKPTHQRKGIGKGLVDNIEKIYKKKGVKLIRLVAKRNAGAFNFYKNLRYQEHKHLVFMEKKIK